MSASAERALKNCEVLETGSVVSVTLTSGDTVEGTVFAHDPSTESLVLEQRVSDASTELPSVVWVNLFNVKKIAIIRKPVESQSFCDLLEGIRSDATALLSKRKVELTAEMKERMTALCDFLRRQRYPCSISDGSILVAKIAEIKAPFTADSVKCTNATTLAKLKHIVDSFERYAAPG